MIPSNASIEEIIKYMPQTREVVMLEEGLHKILTKTEELEDELAIMTDKFEDIDSDDTQKYDLLQLIQDACEVKGGTRKELTSTILMYIEDSGVEL
jgi:hypothetical protein